MLSNTFLSRILHISALGWIRVLVAFLVCFVTAFMKIVFFFIPTSLITWLDWERSRKFFPTIRLFRGKNDEAEPPTLDMCTRQLIEHHGYECEEHTVYTTDGYILTYHRIPRGKNDSLNDDTPRQPVFIMHGLMQCSESWVCHSDSLAYTMADNGFDVWIGNNRGNKYGLKHVEHKPSSGKFWNFSLDEFARYDVPAGIEYITRHTGYPSLTYVGFSQGSAQAFACFSTLPQVAAKVNLFIALSPAAKAQGLTRGMLSTFVKIAPQVIFLAFGTGAMWSSIFFWRRVLTRRFYTNSIDMCCRQLFGWNMSKIGTLARKMDIYAHLYSYTSIKTVVHWFQIVAENNFQQYNDNDYLFKSRYDDAASHVYPIHQIRCPVAVIYGSADFLTDNQWIISKLPRGSVVKAIPDYEHLDTMFAADAQKLVFPDVMSLARLAHEKKNPCKDVLLGVTA